MNQEPEESTRPRPPDFNLVKRKTDALRHEAEIGFEQGALSLPEADTLKSEALDKARVAAASPEFVEWARREYMHTAEGDALDRATFHTGSREGFLAADAAFTVVAVRYVHERGLEQTVQPPAQQTEAQPMTEQPDGGREGLSLSTIWKSLQTAHAEAEQREYAPLTVLDLEANPWHAVNLPLPEHPSPELLEAAKEAAATCADLANDCIRRMRAGEALPGSADMRSAAYDHFKDDYHRAIDRLELIDSQQIEASPMREELTLEAIERGPLNVLKLPLPENASLDLLVKAGRAISQMYQYHELFEHHATTPLDFQIAVGARADEIAAVIGSRVDLGTYPKRPLDGLDICQGKGPFNPPEPEGWALWQHHTKSERGGSDVPPTTQGPKGPPDPPDGGAAVELSAALRPLDAVGIEHAAAVGKSDNIVERPEKPAQPSQQIEGNPMTEERKPADQFKDAASFTTHTPQDRRERDLADVIAQRVEMGGTRDTAEHATFKRSQSELGDRITNEAEPAKRQELRNEREAQGNAYVAELSERVAKGLDTAGQHGAADEFRREAALRREIAGQLRGPDKGGAEQQPSKTDVKDVAADMRAVGAEAGLGRTAETVAVVKGPEPEEQQPQRPHNAPMRAVEVGVGPAGTILTEKRQNQFERFANGVVPKKGDDEQQQNLANAVRYAASKGVTTPGQPPQPGGARPVNKYAGVSTYVAGIRKDLEAKDAERETTRSTFKAAGRGMTR